MKKIFFAIMFWLSVSPAFALICPGVPNSFVPGQVISSSQFNANFTTLLNCLNTGVAQSGANTNITALLGLSSPLPFSAGGTSVANGNLPVTTSGSSTARGVVDRFSETFDAPDYGLVGDGTTSNSMSALATAISAAPNGALAHFPCGVYKITASPTINVPSGKRIKLRGDGHDCTELWFSGANGPYVSYGSVFSSFDVEDMTLTTDGTSYTGLQLVQTHNNGTNQSLQYGPLHTFKDVFFRGHDFYGSRTQYWATAFYEKNVSNINFVGGGCMGNTSYLNLCYSLNGDPAAQSYSVALNFYGTNIGLCNQGISMGDWTQGVETFGANILGCNNPIIVPSGGTGVGSGLLVSSTEINGFTCEICVNATNFNNLQINNSQIIINSNSTGIRVNGTNFVITGNAINCVGTASTANTKGVQLISSYGNGGVVSANAIQNCTYGVANSSGAFARTLVSYNQFTNNTMDYSINASSTGVLVKDGTPRNLSTIVGCGAATIYDEFLQADATAPGYQSVAASGGAYPVHLVCDGTNWRNN